MDSKELKNLHSAKNYVAICNIWDEEMKHGKPDQLDRWNGIFLMNGLYNQKRYKDCLELYKLFRSLYKEDNALNDKMGWSLYQLYFKDYNFSEYNKDIFSKAEFVIQQCADTIYSPKGKVIMLLAKPVDKQTNPTKSAMAKALNYLNQGAAECFSREERMYKVDGKEKAVASELEEWYSLRSKFSLNIGKHEECVEICNEALRNLTAFHYDNDVWFRYRLVKCYFALNKSEEAVKLKEFLVNKAKLNWSIYKVLFEIARAEKSDNILELAGQCATAGGSHAGKKGFYRELAEHLYSVGMYEEAMLHKQLVLKLNEEDGGKAVAFTSEWDISEEIANMKTGEIIRKLKEIWTAWKESNLVFSSGIICKILPNGKSGFIKDDKGNSYYFNFNDSNCNKKGLTEGVKVKYTLENRLDKSKNVVKQNAVNISVMPR